MPELPQDLFLTSKSAILGRFALSIGTAALRSYGLSVHKNQSERRECRRYKRKKILRKVCASASPQDLRKTHLYMQNLFQKFRYSVFPVGSGHILGGGPSRYRRISHSYATTGNRQHGNIVGPIAKYCRLF